MERKERYGRFVLNHQECASSAGSFHRAAEIGPGGYERHVQIFRSIPLPPDVLQATADGLKLGAQVVHAQIPRVFEAGRQETTAFVAAELVEGRSVAALMERSRRDAHPFAVDHALLIASKAAAALEAAQAKRRIHGFLLPEFIQVSWDGEVTVRAFGLNPRLLLANGAVSESDARYLAPEVGAGAGLDIRCDVFSLGAQLFEMLTGAALPRGVAAASSVRAARTPVHGGDGGPLPAALVSLLEQALAEDPAARYRDAASFKKAVDTLLFSGDYSPTTFNLAFFMHTLFRDEGDAESAKIKAERGFDYRAVAESVAPASAVPAAPRSAPTVAPSSEAARPEVPRAVKTAPPTAPVPTPIPEAPLFSSTAAPEKPRPNLVPVVAVVVVLLAAGGYFLTRPGSGGAPAASPQPTMNPAETAALARVRELESRLAALEAEKVAAEQQAVDEAKRKLEAQAKARGREVDPAELQRAQDAARLKAQADQDARLAVERQKIEDEKRRADEARLAEAAKPVEPAPSTPVATPASTPVAPAPAAATPSTSAPSAPPVAAAPAEAAPAPAANAGASSLLDLSDPGVVPPQLISQPRLEYPPVARAQRVMGSVVISALVDEQGNVVEARVIRGVASNTGLNQAALDSVRKRKYKPATLNGKPGRTWVAIQIDFKL